MRFILRQGTDAAAVADATLLKTLGLPSGGVVSIGQTHCVIRPGAVPAPTDLLVGPRTLRNAELRAGQSADVVRAHLTTAALIRLDDKAIDPGSLIAVMQGKPVTTGDRIEVEGREVEVTGVEPRGAGLVGSHTRVTNGDGAAGEAEIPPNSAEVEPGLTSEQALLAGLDQPRELLVGWLHLLTAPGNLPQTWGLPRVAGVWVEAPPGCGRPELVRAAAADIEVPLDEVSLDRIFKPERLLDVLNGALDRAGDRRVILLDRIELLTGDDALSNYRTQFGAVLRWFLDSVAEKPGLATVLGTAFLGRIEPALAENPMLPRSLSIPPPDLDRRRRLFEAALREVPASEVDFNTLANRSAGFSGTDIVAAVLGASAGIARRGGELTTAEIVEAIAETVPSLGSASMGAIPSYGFEQVADLADVKQRLTEAVIWPITQPDRFTTLGIEPPRGILLFGPPGTGKTFVVRAVAHEAGAAFFPIKGAELLDKYVGESERGVRDVFARARNAAPSIVFFDELDALAPVRGSSTTSVTDSVVAALLTELDGIVERGNVCVIGATNRPDLIDPALLRSGRFETHIELGLPQADAIRALLGISEVPFDDDVDLDRLAGHSVGLSFADVDGMLREAALTALRRNANLVSWADLEAARSRFG